MIPAFQDAGRQRARKLAQAALRDGAPLRWFDQFYREAEGHILEIPWARGGEANPDLLRWVRRLHVSGKGRRAAVVGCGLGDDAEALRRLGFEVTAFDLSETAIAWCRSRFPDLDVDYRVADLLDLPDEWGGAFDFVLESLTIQALPRSLRSQAVQAVANLVAPGGTLLVISHALLGASGNGLGASENGSATDEGPPWPVTRLELDRFQEEGLREVALEHYVDLQRSDVTRWRGEYRRPADGSLKG